MEKHSQSSNRFNFDAFDLLVAEGLQEYEELKVAAEALLAEIDKDFEAVIDFHNQ